MDANKNINFDEDQIDPDSFFSQKRNYSDLINKLKNINYPVDNSISVDRSNEGYEKFNPPIQESAIVYKSEEEEKEEVLRKYSSSFNNSLNSNSVTNGAEGIGSNGTVNSNTESPINNSNRIVSGPNVERVDINREDPIITIFRNSKKSLDFNMDIDFQDKIPRLDFIEMMEDSYEYSIIDFLAREFTAKIIQNPKLIEDKIRERIRYLVYGDEIHNASDSEVKPKNTIVEKSDKPKKPNYRKRIEIISKLETIEEIKSAIEDETSASVLKVAHKRINSLKNK